MSEMHWKFAQRQPQPVRRGAHAPDRWEAIKALRIAPPVVVKRVDLQLVHDKKGNVVGAVNRAYRRGTQGRFRGLPVVATSPRAARLTSVDPDGQASSLRLNRAARRQSLREAREAAAA